MTVTFADADTSPEGFLRVKVYFPESERIEKGISNTVCLSFVLMSMRLEGSTGLPLIDHMAVGGGAPWIGTVKATGFPARTLMSSRAALSKDGATVRIYISVSSI